MTKIEIEKKPVPDSDDVLNAVQVLMQACHHRAWNAGWWHDPVTGKFKERNFGEMIALCHSELSEALEGHRKDLMDDHLPFMKMVPVELGDCIIRIFDMFGALYPEQIEAIVQKMHYNDQRADHKLENRAKADGKKY